MHELEHDAARDIKASREDGEDAEASSAEKAGQSETVENDEDDGRGNDAGTTEEAKEKKVQLSRSPKGEPELWLGSLRIEW